MRLPTRAVGLATAVAASCAALFLAAPTQALENPTAPVVSALDFHASASVDGGDLSINPQPSDSIPPADEPAVIVEHAVQTSANDGASTRQPSRPLEELVGTYAASSTEDEDHECLASAVYFESKGEPLRGQLSVAEVILNRAHSGRFPPSACGVVKQSGQFSFVHGGVLPAVARDSAAWRKAVAIAHIAKANLADGAAPKALFFHARSVGSSWRGKVKVAAVGNHVFYR